MNKRVLQDSLGWGLALWFIGYVLGIILVFAVPTSLVGWIIMPVGTLIMLWVLLTKINGTFTHFAIVATLWIIIAILFDYLFIVQAFKPADGYYKLDVYVYYALTFIVPIVIGWRKGANLIR
jgi:hypothetical protein